MEDQAFIRNKSGSLTAVCCAVLVLIAGCSSSPKNSEPASSNPFSTNGTNNASAIKINKLRTFGDSYTDLAYTSPRAMTNWAVEVSSMANGLENYAIGGAKAASTSSIDFATQLNNWNTTNSAITDKDLTVVYFGYNDIGRGGTSDNFAAARAGYTEGVNRLIAGGATNGNNRMFVTLITDWSRTPGISDSLHSQVVTWNNFVASVANSNPNIIAVDLYTVFNRVQDKPSDFGLVNATDVDKERSYTDYLFFDTLHPGSKGQEIIARVFKHYLTRGWNWASTLDAGTSATNQLNQDLDNNLLKAFNQTATTSQGLRLVPLTTSNTDGRRSGRDSRVFNLNQTARNNLEESVANGVALDFAPANSGIWSQGRLGVALTQNAQSTRLTDIEDRYSTRFNSNATTLYWMQPYNNFLFSTQLSRLDHAFTQNGLDDLLNRSVTNDRSAHTWSLEGKLRYTYAFDGLALTPWASLSQQNHTLNGGLIQSLYTSDVQFSQTKTRDIYSGLGVDLQFSPIAIGQGRKLLIGAGLNHLQSLRREALTLGMTEQINPGVQMSETIDRSRVRKTQLSLNAVVAEHKGISYGASYAVDLQKPSETKAVRVTANIPF